MTETTAEKYFKRMAYSVREFVEALDLTDWDCMPKMYFEFTDMHKMKRAEVILLSELTSLMPYTSPKRNIDADAIEIEVAGITVVFRCMTRMKNMQGTDVGYTAIKFKTRSGL